METFARLLTLCGDAVRAGANYLLDGLAWLWMWIDALLQPVLSPALAWLNPICTQIGDAVYGLLDPLPPWAGLTIISVAAGIVMLIAFKFLSNQKAIARAKDDIKANLLALKLFKDDLGVTFRCQWRLFKAIVRLQRYVLTPVIILLPPMLLALAQMGIRYQWCPLRVGEQALVTVTLDPSSEQPATATLRAAGGNLPATGGGVPASPPATTVDTNLTAEHVTLTESPGVEIEIDGIYGDGNIVGRIRAVQPGRHKLVFASLAGTSPEKEIVIADAGGADSLPVDQRSNPDTQPAAGRALARVCPIRPGAHWTQQLLYPVETPVPPESGISSIEIAFPLRDHWYYGANWWVLSFFVVSMLTALILRPVFGVKF